MLSKYEKKYVLKENDFDRLGRIKPSAILRYFENAASNHSTLLGVGTDDMFLRGHLWVVVKIKFEQYKNPSVGEEISMTTWPLAPTKIASQREYSVFDSCGNLIIAGSAEWLIINSKTRTIERMKNIFPDDMIYETENVLKEGFSKPKRAIDGDLICSVSPKEDDIDFNGHVNNSVYADFVCDSIEISENIKSFQLNFHREVMLGDAIRLYEKESDSAIDVLGENENGDIMFSCTINY